MKLIHALTLPLFAFALLGVAYAAESEKPQVSIEQLHNDLRKLKSEVEAAMNKGDIDGVLKHAHKDVIFTSLNAGGGRGHAKVREYHDKLMKAPGHTVESVNVTFTPDELSLLYGGDTAISWGSSLGKYKLVGGAEYEITSRWTSTLVRENDRWSIASFHMSANMFDNPVLSALSKTLYWVTGIAALVALLIGFWSGAGPGARLHWMTRDRIPGTLNLFLLAGAICAAAALLWLASHAANAWTVLAAAVVFWYINNTVFSLLHESVHGILHDDRRVNEAAGIVAAALVPTGLSFQRVFHLSHHARNRSDDEQFDYLRPGDSRLLKHAQWYAILTGLYWVFLPLGCIVCLLAPWVFRLRVFRSHDGSLGKQTGAAAMFSGIDRADRLRMRLEILFSVAFQMALIALFDLSFTGWLACYIAYAVNWSSLQYADHAYSPLDVKNGAWNLRVNRVVQWLFLNYHHHLAHHQHPSVPWIHLPRYVNFSTARPSFLSVYISMWRGPRPMPRDP